MALLVGVYVTRYLGPEGKGVLSYAVSFIGIFAGIARLGLDNIVIRDFVKFPHREHEIMGTAFRLRAIGTFAMWGAVALVLPVMGNSTQTTAILCIAAVAVLFKSFDIVDFYFKARVESKYAVYAHIIQILMSSAAKLFFIWIKAPLMWFAMLLLAEAAVRAGALATLYVKRHGTMRNWRWHRGIAASLIRDAWPLMLASIVFTINQRVDQIMIKEMLGLTQVGLYSAAATLSHVCDVFPSAIATSLFPAVIAAKKEGENRYYGRLQGLFDLMFWLAVLIALPVSFLTPWIIRILYGSAFAPAAGVLSIHIWANVFVFLSYASSRWIEIENLAYISAYVNTGGAVLNVLLNFILIPKFGINGAAFATLCSMAFASHISFLFLRKSRILFFMQNKSVVRPIIRGVKFTWQMFRQK